MQRHLKHVLPKINQPSTNKPLRGRGQFKPGVMNGQEAKYAAHLELRRLAGEILWFKYDAIKLRLAPKTFYSPDFLVMTSDGFLEIHEVKGFMEDDAAVKIKVIAETFPFKFFLILRGDPRTIKEI